MSVSQNIFLRKIIFWLNGANFVCASHASWCVLHVNPNGIFQERVTFQLTQFACYSGKKQKTRFLSLRMDKKKRWDVCRD